MTYVIKCHFMTFYDICHMTSTVIKCCSMGIKRTTLIRRINLRNLGFVNRNNFFQKMQKTETQVFSFYFLSKCLENFNPHELPLNLNQIQSNFTHFIFILASIKIMGKRAKTGNFQTFLIFEQPYDKFGGSR